MFNKKHKSQAFLIYAALIAIVATMLIIMAPYIMGRISGGIRQPAMPSIFNEAVPT